MKPLTEREIQRCIMLQGMPEHFCYWARCVALDPNPTEQQILTVREIISNNHYDNLKHWIFEDKLRLRPVSTFHKVQKTTQKAQRG